MESLRRFSFSQQEVDNSNALKLYNEDILLDNDELPQSQKFVPPSPPMSVWSFAMSSNHSEQLSSNKSEELSEGFELCDAKNLRYHRNIGAVTPSVRHSIATTDADYGFSVAISDSESSFSQEEEIYSELLSISSDIPREIVVRKSLSQRFPFLRRLSRKLSRHSDRKLEL